MDHRLKFFHDGISTYTRRKYARLALDKYIAAQKAMDQLTNRIVNNKSALVLIGAANMSPSSPIKKYQRCPGTRKLATSLKKKRNCDIVFVDEYKTSQKCGRCFQQFPDGTRADRMKCCKRCVPLAEAEPASTITSLINKRKLVALRRKKEEEQAQQQQGAYPQHISAVMVSKKTQLVKKTKLLPVTEEEYVGSTIWHRDISAAKLILYKGILLNSIKFRKRMNYIYFFIFHFAIGICSILGKELNPAFKRSIDTQ